MARNANEPQVRFTRRPEAPDKLLIVTVEDGTNTVILQPEEAVTVYLRLGQLLADFGLTERTGDGDD